MKYNYYHKRREKGLCASCNNMAIFGRVSCQRCIDWQKQYHKRPEIRRRNNESSLRRYHRPEIKERYRQYREKNREQRIVSSQIYRQKTRKQIFDHYGMVCVCCGEKEQEFLTLDHINGNGLTHLRTLFGKSKARGGMPFYRRLIKDGFPDGLQTLCYNCNIAKGTNKTCPHQTNK